MIEAAKTTASAGEVWAICVVAVSCLAFWLIMVAWADRNPIWRGRNVHVSEMEGPVLGGMHVAGGGRSVAPNRDAPSVLTDVDDVPYNQRDYEPEHEMSEQWREAPPGTGEFWVPVQRGAEQAPAQPQPTRAEQATDQAGAGQVMPAQRTGDADRPEPSVAEPGPADQGGDRN